MKITKVLALIMISVFALNSCGKKSEPVNKAHDEFKSESTLEIETIQGEHYIAIAAPLTGPYRELGKTVVEGATIAVEEFNNQLGTNKVGTIIIDDGGIVAEALGKANLLIEQQVLGVVGHLNSEVSVEASKKYHMAKIPQISPASTHPKLTERPEVRGYVFRTVGTDRQLGEAAADYVISNATAKNIAVLYNDRPYGISVASEFVRNLAKDPEKKIVFYETIPVRTKDHGATAKKVAAKQPDLVFFIGEYNDAGYLVKELKSRLPQIQFLGSEGIHNENFIHIAGKDAEGAIVLGTNTLEAQASDRYKAKYKKEDLGFVSPSYEAAKVLLNAAKQSGFANSESVAKLVSQNPLFDLNGDLIKPNFKLYQVAGGKFTTR